MKMILSYSSILNFYEHCNHGDQWFYNSCGLFKQYESKYGSTCFFKVDNAKLFYFYEYSIYYFSLSQLVPKYFVKYFS